MSIIDGEEHDLAEEPRPTEEEKQLLMEQAAIEAERMELYEGGPLADANFYDHDPFCYDGPDD